MPLRGRDPFSLVNLFLSFLFIFYEDLFFWIYKFQLIYVSSKSRFLYFANSNVQKIIHFWGWTWCWQVCHSFQSSKLFIYLFIFGLWMQLLDFIFSMKFLYLSNCYVRLSRFSLKSQTHAWHANLILLLLIVHYFKITDLFRYKSIINTCLANFDACVSQNESYSQTS